jgi:hypothetical protein
MTRTTSSIQNIKLRPLNANGTMCTVHCTLYNVQFTVSLRLNLFLHPPHNNECVNCLLESVPVNVQYQLSLVTTVVRYLYLSVSPICV